LEETLRLPGKIIAEEVRQHPYSYLMERRLWLLRDAGVLDIIPLTDVDSTYEFTLEPAGRSYVRAELRGPRGRPERGEVVWAMGNPIWIQRT